MKRIHLSYILSAVVTLLALAGCKTTEKNYRAAYEKAVANENRGVTDFDQTIYGRYRAQVRDTPMALGDSTVMTRTARVAVTQDGGGINEWLKRYSVVVGEFKQLFNARSLRGRYADAGFARCFLVQNAEPYYYIVVGSSDNLAEMVALRDSVAAHPVVPMKDGFPYILQKIR